MAILPSQIHFLCRATAGPCCRPFLLCNRLCSLMMYTACSSSVSHSRPWHMLQFKATLT